MMWFWMIVAVVAGTFGFLVKSNAGDWAYIICGLSVILFFVSLLTRVIRSVRGSGNEQGREYRPNWDSGNG